MRELADKAVVVTGAGNRIGRAIAIEAAHQGARVIVNDIDTAAADRVADEIHDDGDWAAACHASDATWPGAKVIIDACIAHFGRIDGLVNYAATHP
jgi:NAD(P)-dependent dehydrogenase (short-subunit alcohol dehydrogenase family)